MNIKEAIARIATLPDGAMLSVIDVLEWENYGFLRWRIVDHLNQDGIAEPGRESSE